MHIGPTRFLKFGLPNVEYNSEGRLYKRYTGIDWGDKGEIAVAMATGDNKVADDKDPRKKTRQLKKEKQ